jgi:hypothetical protein
MPHAYSFLLSFFSSASINHKEDKKAPFLFKIQVVLGIDFHERSVFIFGDCI